MKYLIYTHGEGWFCFPQCGFTLDIVKAHRYDEADAHYRCDVANCIASIRNKTIYYPAPESVAELQAIVDKLPLLVQDLCERRELKPCWYDDDADCGNWPTCQVDCVLNELRSLVGLSPQEDGGIDKQPEATDA